jgi:hypothetical protein
MLVTVPRLRPVVAALVVFVTIQPGILAQESKSAAAAKELAQLLESQKLDSIASRDPAEKDQYVAALYLPGQLLVVSARYSAPALLDQKIAKKEYRDVYIDLNSAAVANTKMFVEDLNADGLQSERNDDQPFDTIENGSTRVEFHGEWRKQKMSEQDYMKSYGDADDRYSKMLMVLLTELKKPS